MKEKLSPLLKRITLKQLRVVSAIDQVGTMSGAARLLNVTPPAVNLQLRLLEESVGMALFDRLNVGMRPTSVGSDLLGVAAQIETTLNDFCETLDVLRSGEVGNVRVGVVSTAKYFAPRVLSGYLKLHPAVNIRLQVGNRGEMIAALDHHQIDFVIMGLPPADLDIDKEVIADHPHIIIAPPDHHLIGTRNIKLNGLTKENFLLRENSSGTRMLMHRLFDEAGLNPNLGMEIGSNETIKQAVMAGLGIALISAHTVQLELEGGYLSELDVVGLPVIRQWYLVKLNKKRLTAVSEALWEFFVISSKQFLPGTHKRKIKTS